jgi:hypothetical protein
VARANGNRVATRRRLAGYIQRMAAVTMDREPAIDPRRCPAQARKGGQCKNAAGKATEHVGFGYCRFHGGMTPALQAHAAKLAALAAMPPTGGEIDVNPLDALLYTVRRAAGLALWYRAKLEAASLEGANPEPWATLEAKALGDLNRWGKAAVDAGVAERLVRAAEHSAERIGAAVEAMFTAMAAAGVELTPDARAAAVRAFTGQIAQLETGGGDIEAVGHDA